MDVRRGPREDGWEDQQRRAAAVLREHEKATYWSRLFIFAFYGIFVVTMLWAIPWLPYGTSTADHNANILSALLLAGTTGGLAGSPCECAGDKDAPKRRLSRGRPSITACSTCGAGSTSTTDYSAKARERTPPARG